MTWVGWTGVFIMGALLLNIWMIGPFFRDETHERTIKRRILVLGTIGLALYTIDLIR